MSVCHYCRGFCDVLVPRRCPMRDGLRDCERAYTFRANTLISLRLWDQDRRSYRERIANAPVSAFDRAGARPAEEALRSYEVDVLPFVSPTTYEITCYAAGRGDALHLSESSNLSGKHSFRRLAHWDPEVRRWIRYEAVKGETAP